MNALLLQWRSEEGRCGSEINSFLIESVTNVCRMDSQPVRSE